MKKRNVLTLVLALVLVAALAVGGTLAYFTDKDEASNTFTMGKVDINLHESDDDGATWEENGLQYTKVLPGNEEKKWAQVTVDANSEDCYVMVSVQITTPTDTKLTPENISDLYDAIETAIGTTNWDVTTVTNSTGDRMLQCVYKGTNNDKTAHAGDELDLFKTITIPGEEFGNNTAGQTFNIVMNAYAIQKANVTYADTIWSGNFEQYPILPQE